MRLSLVFIKGYLLTYVLKRVMCDLSACSRNKLSAFEACYRKIFYQLLAASLSISTIERKRIFLQVCRLNCQSVRLFVLSVGWSVRWVNCGKTAHWICRMSFEVASRVGRGMVVLDGGSQGV